jgi:hypothetical protein
MSKNNANATGAVQYPAAIDIKPSANMQRTVHNHRRAMLGHAHALPAASFGMVPKQSRQCLWVVIVGR